MPARSFDLVCCFDCVHDMGDPVGSLTHVRGALKANGTLMIVEPYAGDALEENLTPVGRIFYAASTMLCTPSSLAQEVGLALGAQAGEARIREVVKNAGFTQFRRAARKRRSISSTKHGHSRRSTRRAGKLPRPPCAAAAACLLDPPLPLESDSLVI